MSHEKEEHNKILKLEIGSVKFVIRAQFRTIIPHVSPLNVRALLFKQINNLLGSICLPGLGKMMPWNYDQQRLVPIIKEKGFASSCMIIC